METEYVIKALLHHNLIFLSKLTKNMTQISAMTSKEDGSCYSCSYNNQKTDFEQTEN